VSIYFSLLEMGIKGDLKMECFFLHKNLPWPLLIPQKSAIWGPSFPKRGIKRGALPKMVIKEVYSNKPMELIFFL
jgi:hypothetical protein